MAGTDIFFTTRSDLESVADAIRIKGGTSSDLEYPDGFITAIGNISGGGGSPTLQTKSKSYTPTSSEQYEEVSYDSPYDGLDQVNITVAAIPSNYVIPTGEFAITSNNTYNIAQYATVAVNVPSSGQTINNQNKTVSPSDSSFSFTCDSGSDYTGLGTVTVNAMPADHVGTGIARKNSSNLSANGATVTAPAGYYASDATKSVDSMTLPTNTAASATSGYTSKATVSRSTSDQYINIPTGYNSAGAYYKISAVANGSATGPSSVSSTGATVSTGTNTLTLTKTGVSTTPTVSAGYVASATSSTATVSLTASVTTKGTATITPTTTNQTISSGTYITGTQTISGDANLVASNIKNGVPIFGVTGSYTGSGGGVTGVAKGTLTVASNVNTSTNTKITDTSTIGFTPTAFLFYRSDRSATSNHVNAATFITLGSSYYIGTRTRYSSNALSTSGNTTNWTTQSSGYLYFNSNNVYFRSSSSYILAQGTWYWVAIQ